MSDQAKDIETFPEYRRLYDEKFRNIEGELQKVHESHGETTRQLVRLSTDVALVSSKSDNLDKKVDEVSKRADKKIDEVGDKVEAIGGKVDGLVDAFNKMQDDDSGFQIKLPPWAWKAGGGLVVISGAAVAGVESGVVKSLLALLFGA